MGQARVRRAWGTLGIAAGLIACSEGAGAGQNHGTGGVDGGDVAAHSGADGGDAADVAEVAEADGGADGDGGEDSKGADITSDSDSDSDSDWDSDSDAATAGDGNAKDPDADVLAPDAETTSDADSAAGGDVPCQASTELCNGADDDCDGVTDDAISCDDANICTDDGCGPGKDGGIGCQHIAAAGPCDDGDLCTGGEACDGGLCGGGIVAACNDMNECTSDSCDASGPGCTHDVIAGCGLACTVELLNCPKPLYCRAVVDLTCGGAGHCDPKPAACPADANKPVCGCDGATWPSACAAATAGVNVALPGPCQP